MADRFIECYADALELYESIKPWRGSTDRPWASRTHSKKRMRKLDDNAIAFEYQGTVFAIWHPDNKLTVENFGSAQQKVVWHWILPGSILLDEGTRIGSVVMTCPTNQVRECRYWGSRFPMYLPKSGQLTPYGGVAWGDRKTNPDVMVFRNPRQLTLDYCAERQMWWPVDEAGLEPFTWDEIDKPASRKLLAEYRLSDFEAYLRAFTMLEGELQSFESFDDEALVAHIKVGEFVEAMKYMPRGEGWLHRYYGGSSYWSQRATQTIDDTKTPPTWSYFGKLRTQLYKQQDCLVERSEKILSLKEYQRVKGLLYRFS